MEVPIVVGTSEGVGEEPITTGVGVAVPVGVGSGVKVGVRVGGSVAVGPDIAVWVGVCSNAV